MAPEGTPLYHLHDSTLIVDEDNSHGSPVLQNTLIKRGYEWRRRAVGIVFGSGIVM